MGVFPRYENPDDSDYCFETSNYASFLLQNALSSRDVCDVQLNKRTTINQTSGKVNGAAVVVVRGLAAAVPPSHHVILRGPMGM